MRKDCNACSGFTIGSSTTKSDTGAKTKTNATMPVSSTPEAMGGKDSPFLREESFIEAAGMEVGRPRLLVETRGIFLSLTDSTGFILGLV